jgi:membrane fusion protein, multidrug efflux system
MEGDAGLKMLKHLFAVVLACSAVAGFARAEDPQVRGIVKALNEATIAIDYAARIVKMPFLEGQSFKQGDLLIAFDCKKYVAEVNAARAGARAAELLYGNNRKLLARGAMGANEVEISQAQMLKAQAETQALQARTGSCNFKAPFDGRMVQRLVQEQESPAPNQPLIKIVGSSKLEIEIIVPSKWLNWMKPGVVFSFTIDETGQTVTAEVVRVGAMVDAVSQTIKAYGVLKTKDQSVLPGMSGTATFPSLGS